MTTTDLPVLTVLPDVKSSLHAGHVILAAPPGSGKTTAIPPALLHEPWLAGKKILLLEPRRLAVRAAARRMSFLAGEPVGTTIGYRTRLDSKVSAATKIEVITEGILIRRLQNDPELQDTGLLIFDEFHERTLTADLGLALALDLCLLRPNLRIIVMSATLDCQELSTIMENSAVIQAQGTHYPVQMHHSHPIEDPRAIARITAKAVLSIIQENEGDLLVFLPGVGEINKCRKILEEHDNHCTILPLFGNLSVQDQDRAVQSQAGKTRRIILTTPIAETSLTIEGISIVVDCGFARRPRFDPATGLNRLQTVRISRASARQRQGRAGRLGPGICFRLWDKNTEHSLQDFSPPEISLSDLSSLVLELALWGVTDAKELRWLTLPPTANWKRAQKLLRTLSALDTQNRITTMGRKLVTLPIHPRLGHMLLQAKKQHLGATACLIAAILSERDIFSGQRDVTDLSERLKVFTGTTNRYSSTALFRRISKQAKRYQKQLDCDGDRDILPEECGALLISAFPERIGVLRQGCRDRYLMAGGRGAVLPPGDLLAGTELLIFPQLDGGRKEGKIYLAAEIHLSDLKEQHPELLTFQDTIVWNDSGSRIIMQHTCRLGKAVVESSPMRDVDQAVLLDIFLQGIQRVGLSYLPWKKESKMLQAQVECLRFWGINKLPDLSDPTLLANLQWLAPYCTKMTRLSQLSRLNLHSILLALLTWEQQKTVETLAPEHLRVASGSRIRLDYVPGKPPVLAVRLQELFGQTETPSVCGGRIPVLLHLLSPARRPVQVTDDLHSFWKNAYSQVKKELKGRYPKHYWPDDPLRAQATSRCKPR